MPASYHLRPAPSEYPPYQAAYMQRVPEGDVIAMLATQLDETLAALDGLSEAQAERGYAAGKWSVKQVLGHLADVERVFAYRGLRIGRGDATPLPGFEQDDYIETAHFDDRPLADLAAELRAVRAATVALFRALPEAAMTRTGTASGHPFSARAAAFMIAGHERHHRWLFEERYLPVL